jgi:AcrR family transcriptional regulator
VSDRADDDPQAMGEVDPAAPHGAIEVRSALILAAMRQLEETSPSRLSLRAVADEAGVNKGLIHRHFGSKAALLAAVMYQVRDDSLGEVDTETAIIDLLFRPIEWIVGNPVMGRILIWMANEQIDPSVFATGYPVVRRSEELLEVAGVENPRAVVAHQLSAAYGWIAFETNMMHALDQDQTDHAREQFLSYARSLLERELRTEQPQADQRPPTA